MAPPEAQEHQQPLPARVIQELPHSGEHPGDLRQAEEEKPSYPPTPALFSSYPPIKDELETDTSEAQDETVETCLPFLVGNPLNHELNSYGIPKLQRSLHIAFLRNMLGKYPGKFMAMDASRPWIFYWAIAGLAMLGVDVSEYRER
jgi:protein farnesyltransferase subunit beta